MWMLEVEEVGRDIMADKLFSGHQQLRFEANLDNMHGGKANKGVAIQIGQIR